MNNFFFGFLIAFSMYSKLPVPAIKWTKERMRYALCWFPGVGIVCGALLWFWLRLAVFWEIHPVLAGALGVVIPVFVTGGIHLDGFLDTLDARSSYAEREKKLEILSDPHTGAFAIIGFGVYMLLYTGALVQLYVDAAASGQWDVAEAFCLVFSLERACSGLSVVTFPCAKNSGLARIFSDSAQKNVTMAVLLLWIAGLCCGLAGIGWKELAAAGGTVLLVFVYYKKMADREFGGITGDLAGWFLQMAELAALLVLLGVSHSVKG